MARYREDQGKTSDKYQFASQPDTGHNAHDRQHAGSFKAREVFKPLPVCLSEQAHQNPHYEEICVADPIEPVVRVDEGGVSSILLAVGLLSIAFIRRFS